MQNTDLQEYDAETGEVTIIETDDSAHDIEYTEPAEKPVTNVARQTMIGDLRDVVLDIFKDKRFTGKAWVDMKEGEQKAVAQMVTDHVTEAVVRSIDIIHSDGQKHIKAVLRQVTVKDGYKAVFECSASDKLRHELVDSQGDTILVVLTNTDAYLGEREKVKFDKDEPELPMKEIEIPIPEDNENYETENRTSNGSLEAQADEYI